MASRRNVWRSRGVRCPRKMPDDVESTGPDCSGIAPDFLFPGKRPEAGRCSLKARPRLPLLQSGQQRRHRPARFDKRADPAAGLSQTYGFRQSRQASVTVSLPFQGQRLENRDLNGLAAKPGGFALSPSVCKIVIACSRLSREPTAINTRARVSQGTSNQKKSPAAVGATLGLVPIWLWMSGRRAAARAWPCTTRPRPGIEATFALGQRLSAALALRQLLFADPEVAV